MTAEDRSQQDASQQDGPPHDPTARRLGEMQAMLAHIGHGVILWDAQRRVLAASPVAAELLGAAEGLLVPGRSLEDIVRSALDRGNLGHGATARERARRLLEQDRSTPHHDQRLTRGGRVLEVRSDPVPGGGFVTTYTDVTEHREAEDALRLAKTAAEAANAAKSRFLAAMGTELRSPLATIQAELGALARDSAVRVRHAGPDAGGIDAAQVQRACDAALDAARRLLGMIDTVLDVARLESGRFDLAADIIEVPVLVRACLRQSDSAAAAAEVALVVDIPEALPSLRCDERRMRQALSHLVANAVRCTAAMGSVCIAARHEWTTGDLLLSVQDTGIGIAPEDLERLFEPFTQLDPPPGRRGSGAGLGLYVSRTLMRAHGGDLTLRSTPGQGTTAVIRVPAARTVHPDGRHPT